MIYIRTDANPNIGMGHIMRCLSIADAFHSEGQDVTFINADDNIKILIEQRGFADFILYSDYRDMESELHSWDALDVRHEDYIIVDSYYVTWYYFESLRAKVDHKLVYIDDCMAFPYPVDVLVNYNIYGRKENYTALYLDAGMEPPQLIMGPTYAPLRSMFCDLPKKQQPERVRDVLISTGGTDPFHIALSLVKLCPQNFMYHVLVGMLNSDGEEIRKIAKENPHIILHENVSDMVNLIRSCDIAVSAAGSTLYEICACGVPVITYVIADNQKPGAEAFVKEGLAINLGDLRKGLFSAERIIDAVEDLSRDYKKRVKIGTHMQDLIDGYGAHRLAKNIKA